MYLHRLLNNTQIFVFLNGRVRNNQKKRSVEREAQKKDEIIKIESKRKKMGTSEWDKKKYNALIKALKSP